MSDRARWYPDAYAGFWRRAGGLLIDAAAVWGVYGIASLALPSGAERTDVATGFMLFILLGAGVYDVLMTSRWGWTLGKRAVGLEVRTLDGSLPSPGACVLRLFGRWASALPLWLGFAAVAWEPRKQTWHDKIAGTVVLVSERVALLDARPDGAAPAASVALRPPAQATVPAPVAAASGEPWRVPTASTAPADDDPNLVAIDRAQLDAPMADWMRQVAFQVDARLDLVSAQWRGSAHAPTARACVFGLLLGRLASLHPGATDVLDRVAEAHPSFNTLLAGSRLATLEQIASDRRRVATWVGPLIDVEDASRLDTLLD